MAKITKKRALFNSALVNVILAHDDYIKNQLSIETLEYSYKTNNRFVCQFLDTDAYSEFHGNFTVIKVKSVLGIV